MRRTKGFTLVELLVVIGIIALLVSILMPALGRARELAKRIQCASQLNGIGKAIAMYQNEYRDANPKAWKRNHPELLWGFGGKGSITDYNAPELDPATAARQDWANKDINYATRNPQTAGSCLYLLVKHEDVDPKMFICPSAPEDRIMGLDEAIDFADIKSLPIIDLWEDLNDFGYSNHLSYSYNDPWNRALDSSASASLVLAADKNQAFDHDENDCGFMKNIDADTRPNTGDNPHLGYSDEFSGTWDDTSIVAGADTNPRHGNSKNHQTEAQNVLFADTHVKKYNNPCVGVAEDNIYTYWDSTLADFRPKMQGAWGDGGAGADQMYDGNISSGASDNDSYLGN